MKNVATITSTISERPIRTITDENKHTFPKKIQEAFETMSKKDGFKVTPKYLSMQEFSLKDGTCKLYREQPDLSLVKVVIDMLQGLPDFLPADNLVHVTDFVLKEWKKLQEDEAYSQRRILADAFEDTETENESAL